MSWEDEPNFKKWTYKGYTCMIRRGPVGALCGYVGLKKGHRLYGKYYNEDKELENIDCHGGLTFSGEWDELQDDLWYIGFDCAHAFDFIPGLMTMHESTYLPMMEEATYRDFDYVTKECEKIVDQL
jgi:hypothetical protein